MSVSNKLFEYLTEPENYLNAKEIQGFLPEIEERLIKEFWTEIVFEKLKEENIFEFDLIPLNLYSQIKLQNDAWKGLCICIENKFSFSAKSDDIYFAIQWNKDEFDITKTQRIIAEQNLLLMNYSLDNRWLTWEKISDYKDDSRKILPKNREIEAEQVINSFKIFIEKHTKLCDKICNEAPK